MTGGVPAEQDPAGQAADAGEELPLRESTLEIFFDLVFAFTLTRGAGDPALLAGRWPGAAGLRAAVVGHS